MSIRAKHFLSASNCVIEFCGTEIGYLQNFRVQANYNLQTVRNLWNDLPQNFVPGNTEYTVTASQGLVEVGSLIGLIANTAEVLDKLGDIFSTDLSLEQKLERVQDISGTIAGAVEDAKSAFAQLPGALNDLWGNMTGQQKTDKTPTNIADITQRIDMLKERWQDFKKNDTTDFLKDLFTRAEFDIVVKNPLTSSSGIADAITQLASWGDGQLWKLGGCKLSARTIEINTGSVMILHNMTILCKTLHDSMVVKSLSEKQQGKKASIGTEAKFSNDELLRKLGIDPDVWKGPPLPEGWALQDGQIIPPTPAGWL